MARKKSSSPKKTTKARTQPPQMIDAELKKRLDEEPRFNPQLFEPKRRKLEVSTDEKNGYDYVFLDVLTSAYLNRIRDSPHFALVSPEPNTLPLQGVIIPLCEFGQQDAVFELERRTLSNEPVESDLGFSLPEEILSIGLRVRGGVDADGDYARGSRIEISTGVLDTRSIEGWKSWRYLGELWFFRFWEKIGLDRFNPDVRTYRLARTSKAIKPVAPRISKHDALLLAITFLFNYWQKCIPQYDPRVLHLKRLGCGHKLDAKTLWTYCSEAGCLSQTRSQAIDMLERVQSESVRFFKKNPVALEEQKISLNQTIRFRLPESKRGKKKQAPRR